MRDWFYAFHIPFPLQLPTLQTMDRHVGISSFYSLIVIGVTTVLCLKLIHDVILRSACLVHLRNQSISKGNISGHPYTKN
jgi:hypothetical protein